MSEKSLGTVQLEIKGKLKTPMLNYTLVLVRPSLMPKLNLIAFSIKINVESKNGSKIVQIKMIQTFDTS